MEVIQEDEATRHARHDRMAWKCVELLAAKVAPKVLTPVTGQKRVHEDSALSDPTDSVAAMFLSTDLKGKDDIY